MKLNLKMLAVSAALLGLLAAGAALPASAAGPLNAAAALSLPWSAAAVESVETGTYASTMTVGTQQQLSPVILPAKAARKATVTFISNDSTIVNVTSEGVAQAVGVGTAQVIASADGVSCVYTITTELDESMIVKEMDITLASGTIAVGETTSLSLGVLPSSASNYANVSLSSSDPAEANDDLRPRPRPHPRHLRRCERFGHGQGRQQRRRPSVHRPEHELCRPQAGRQPHHHRQSDPLFRLPVPHLQVQ